jgi:hypothetical protein
MGARALPPLYHTDTGKKSFDGPVEFSPDKQPAISINRATVSNPFRMMPLLSRKNKMCSGTAENTLPAPMR